jgi:hypothetical protein
MALAAFGADSALNNSWLMFFQEKILARVLHTKKLQEKRFVQGCANALA